VVAHLGKGPARTTEAGRKAEYTAHSDFCGALADLQKHLGALIGALLEHDVEDRTIRLLIIWRHAVRDASNEANQMRDHGQIGVYEDARPKGEGWVGSWHIGGGTFGKTSLYTRQNDRGQLCNWVVVKNAVYNPDIHANNLWNNAEKWFW
jgi:hypothetical protein